MGSDVQGLNLATYVANTQGLIPNPWSRRGGGRSGPVLCCPGAEPFIPMAQAGINTAGTDLKAQDLISNPQ